MSATEILEEAQNLHRVCTRLDSLSEETSSRVRCAPRHLERHSRQRGPVGSAGCDQDIANLGLALGWKQIPNLIRGRYRSGRPPVAGRPLIVQDNTEQ